MKHKVGDSVFFIESQRKVRTGVVIGIAVSGLDGSLLCIPFRPVAHATTSAGEKPTQSPVETTRELIA